METLNAATRSVSSIAWVPTRWGNQLNGNPETEVPLTAGGIPGPHSLGKSIEWKQNTHQLKQRIIGWSPLAGEIN